MKYLCLLLRGNKIMFKKLNLIGIIAGVFFISFAMPCYASGIPGIQAYQAPPAQPQAVVPYVGFDVGYGWSQYKYKTDNTAIITPTVTTQWSDSLPKGNFDNVFLGGLVGAQFNIPSYEQIFLAIQLTFDFYPEGYSYTNKNYLSGGVNPAYAGLRQNWQTGLSILAGYHVTSTLTPYLIGGGTYNGFSTKYKYTINSSTHQIVKILKDLVGCLVLV
jgi:opacity protein-like surface antigen